MNDETTFDAGDPRRFYLQRTADVSGVSGVGRVADGILWPDQTVSIRWRGARPSIVHWASLDDAVHVHGHGGATRFAWVDDDTAIQRCPQHPGAYGYEHPECGFHWHGRDGMDVPMRDGQPVCPRCTPVFPATNAAEDLAVAKRLLGINDVVVLCGSMRFADQMAEVAIVESVAGALVLKPDCNMKHEHPLWADPVEAEALKVRLDDQHRQKIRLADRVIVVGNYAGDSTRSEIAYARELGKPVRFTDPGLAAEFGVLEGEAR